MRRIVLGFIFLLVLQSAALAQGSRDRRGWGYLFGGAGGTGGNGSSTGYFSAGGGAEGLIAGGFGLGGEVGYLGPFESGRDGFGVFSADVGYHFRNASASRKVVPFLTGGYSLAFRSGTSSGGNYGGGIHYWMKDHVGLRFEFRDHIFSSDSPHLFQFRVGLSFR